MAPRSEYNSVTVFGRHYRTPIDFAGFRKGGSQNVGNSVELLLWSKEELAERYGVRQWDKMGNLLDLEGFKRTWGTISGPLRRMHILGEGLYVLDEQAKKLSQNPFRLASRLSSRCIMVMWINASLLQGKTS